MVTHTHLLVTIANELKTLEKRREGLLAELQRIARGISRGLSGGPRRGRPPRASVTAKPRPTTSATRNERKALGPKAPREKTLTAAIVDLLEGSGAAYTAGDIVLALNLPKTKSQIATVSTTLGRLVKEGRARKDEERGYLAA